MPLGYAQHRLLKCERSRVYLHRSITPGRAGVSEPQEEWKHQQPWCKAPCEMYFVTVQGRSRVPGRVRAAMGIFAGRLHAWVDQD